MEVHTGLSVTVTETADDGPEGHHEIPLSRKRLSRAPGHACQTSQTLYMPSWFFADSLLAEKTHKYDGA